MRVQVTIDFPCSAAEWARLEQVRALVGTENFILPSRIAENLTPEEGQVLQALSEAEKELLDTSLLEFCAKNRVGRCKPNVSGMIRDHVTDNPGLTKEELIEAIAEQAAVSREKATNSINQLIYAKPYKRAIAKIGDRIYPT